MKRKLSSLHVALFLLTLTVLFAASTWVLANTGDLLTVSHFTRTEIRLTSIIASIFVLLSSAVLVVYAMKQGGE